MNIGVSTACFYPEELESSFTNLLENDVKLFEIFFNTFSEIQSPFINRILKKMQKYNAVAKSMHPFTSGYESFLLFTDYEKRFDEMLKFYEMYFKAAQKLGIKILVLHGDKRTYEMGGISNENYFEKYYKLFLTGQKYGVTVAQENVNLCRSQKIEFIQEMNNYLGDNVKYVFDIKQAVRSGADPYEMCKTMGGNLIHIHINDNNKKEDCLLPGRGDMDYNKLFKILDDNNYKGDLIIEVYRQNFEDMKDILLAKKHLEVLVANQKYF